MVQSRSRQFAVCRCPRAAATLSLSTSEATGPIGDDDAGLAALQSRRGTAPGDCRSCEIRTVNTSCACRSLALHVRRQQNGRRIDISLSKAVPTIEPDLHAPELWAARCGWLNLHQTPQVIHGSEHHAAVARLPMGSPRSTSRARACGDRLELGRSGRRCGNGGTIRLRSLAGRQRGIIRSRCRLAETRQRS